MSFAAPARRLTRAPSLLGLPQFAILVSGVLLVPLVLVVLFHPVLRERWAWHQVGALAVQALWAPDGRAVAIAERAPGAWTLTVHWGPMLARQADLGLLTAAGGIDVGPLRGVIAQHWENASTLRLATGPMLRRTTVPAQRFRYRIDGALTPLP